MQKVALITGITGQDGSYLAELLLKKNYIVHGIKRRTSLLNTDRIDHIYDNPLYKDKFFLHYGDLTDSTNLIRIIKETQPDEIYNLAAMSHVQVSFESPEYTADVNAMGSLRLLEAIRILGLESKTKFYQASTSELYGKVQETPQKETTPFYPRSPYAAAKLYAYWTCINYREAYNIFACNGILFNHESPVRGETFVTRKITRFVAKLYNKYSNHKEPLSTDKTDILYLGNLDAKRDWGHARDYVEAMWLMLQQDKPEDFVISTGITTTVRQFVIEAFKSVGITLEFKDSNLNEYAIVKESTNLKLSPGTILLKIDKKYYRPTEVDLLLGDPSKANRILGWKAKTPLKNLVQEMVQSDILELK